MLKHLSWAAGLCTLLAAWCIALAGDGMTGHMTAHMISVAVAAPLLAFGGSGTRVDPAARLPGLVAPLPASILELVVVWGWHSPAARAFSTSGSSGLALEQAMFATAGFLLWSACLGGHADPHRRAGGVLAMLLTTMHMTLLGVLITLAPRPLFEHVSAAAGIDAAPSLLLDQQRAGIVMLVVGAGSYLCGGLVMLAGLLRTERTKRVPS